MAQFADVREAKEFLVAKIVDEAQREGVSLSETEHKMLYFSETGWTLPDIAEVNVEFDKYYEQDSYEKKITSLIRSAYKRIRREGGQDRDTWSEVIRILGKEDHYVLVMVEQAGASG